MNTGGRGLGPTPLTTAPGLHLCTGSFTVQPQGPVGRKPGASSLVPGAIRAQKCGGPAGASPTWDRARLQSVVVCGMPPRCLRGRARGAPALGTFTVGVSVSVKGK